MVGWGEVPYLSEFAATGQVLFDAHLPSSYESYRVYRLPWSGHPSDEPALRVAASGARKVLYASWNGAGAVASWQVLSGHSASALAPLGASSPRSGFETAIPLPAGAGPLVAAQARDAAGVAIGASAAVRP
jgi:hypothetical protein